jgi:hypothetical protein
MALAFASSPGGGTGGSALTVTDGTTSVTHTSTLDFTSGVVVTDLGGGTAGAAVTANLDGGSSTSTYLVTSQQLNGGNA